jgi:hypothetical protein
MKKINIKGLLSIQIDGDNKMKVVFRPKEGNIWMNRNELCGLFGCYLKDIDGCIETIFQKEMFRVEDTCRYHIIAGGKRISYDITEVNLSIIIALSFMITTPQAGTLRGYFVEQFMKMKSLDVMIPYIGQNFMLN